MYNSNITVKSLVETIQSEADISTAIPDQCWLNWINEVEQMLYTEVIRELKVVTLTAQTSPIAMTEIVPGTGEGQAIFEDILKFYGDGRELQKATVISALRFAGVKSVWYKQENAIGFSLATLATADEIKIVYCVRPELKVMTSPTAPALPDLPDTDILLPPEFIELMACRLRGEAYKIANEDSQAAKWLADYNAYVESFKTWVKKHNAGFGE